MPGNIRFLFPIAFLLSLCLSWTSCRQGGETSVQNIPVELHTYDLYKDLAGIDTQNIPEGIEALKKEYGAPFMSYFLSHVAGLDTSRGYADSAFQSFFKYHDFRNLLDTVVLAYPQTRDITKEITTLLKHIQHYDSHILIPKKVVYYSATLNSSFFLYDTTDLTLGLGLDMFLGPDFWPYASIGIPEYISKYAVKENIPVTAAMVLFQQQYGTSFDDKTLLEIMLEEGKQMLFLTKVLPDMPPYRFLDMSRQQWEWCEKSELYIYDFLTSNNLLYEKSPMKIMQFISPAPSTNGMPEESPGRTGSFIGYRIMKQYMEQTGMSLQEVLNTEDKAQAILSKAKYKPKK